MKLASIVPVNDIHLTFDGDYAMLLAHLKDFYPKRKHKHCYKIMDNSLIELGGAVSIETVYNAAMQCEADEMILPDVFRKGPQTRELVYKSLDWLNKNCFTYPRIMAVCQGSTIEEFKDCFLHLSSISEIHCIGIPKVSKELLGERYKLEPLWKQCSKDIHLLGCWTNLDEFRHYQNPQLIRSCDTCLPALLSQTTDDPWIDRPTKTIDLLHDKINFTNYNTIMRKLKMENIL